MTSLKEKKLRRRQDERKTILSLQKGTLFIALCNRDRILKDFSPKKGSTIKTCFLGTVYIKRLSTYNLLRKVFIEIFEN